MPDALLFFFFLFFCVGQLSRSSSFHLSLSRTYCPLYRHSHTHEKEPLRFQTFNTIVDHSLLPSLPSITPPLSVLYVSPHSNFTQLFFLLFWPKQAERERESFWHCDRLRTKQVAAFFLFLLFATCFLKTRQTSLGKTKKKS